MDQDRGTIRPVLLAPAIGTTLLIAAAFVWFAGENAAPPVEKAGTVTIVGGPDRVAAPAMRRNPSRPISAPRAAISPADAIAKVRQAYPLLTGATLRCDGDSCVLDGLVLPLSTQVDLDKRQEMLLGGLASLLAANGYVMTVPFQFDEIDDNRFLLKASVTRAQPPI